MLICSYICALPAPQIAEMVTFLLTTVYAFTAMMLIMEIYYNKGMIPMDVSPQTSLLFSFPFIANLPSYLGQQEETSSHCYHSAVFCKLVSVVPTHGLGGRGGGGGGCQTRPCMLELVCCECVCMLCVCLCVPV